MLRFTRSSLRAPAPPPLPSGSVCDVPGRGELFVRRMEGPAAMTPVVLLHGWMATADINFFPLFEPLGERHPVVAPDLRGHGRSLYSESPFSIEAAADDVGALVEHLGFDRVIVAGYSLGAAVAQAFVARHPHLAEGMILAAAEPGGRRRLDKKWFLRNGGWHGSIQRLTAGRWLGHRLVDRAARKNPAIEELRSWLTAEFERGHPASLRQAGRALGRFDGIAVAASSTPVATVSVITRRDRLVRPGRQARLASAWRATTVALDADHDAPIARPTQFVEAMLDAVARVAPRDVAGAGAVA